jgi:hypothetical protein
MYYPSIRLEGLGKIAENLSQDIRRPGRDANQAYESEAL